MKKTVKSKLRLNSQTVRALHDARMQQVLGGRIQMIDTDDSSGCTMGCRGCG